MHLNFEIICWTNFYEVTVDQTVSSDSKRRLAQFHINICDISIVLSVIAQRPVG